MNILTEFEIGILNWIQCTFRCAFLDAFFPFITLFGDAGIFWIAFAIVLLFFKRTRKTGLMMGMALLLGFLIGNMTLKPLIGRIRPYDIETGVVLLVERMGDFSFPSGHTLASFEAATVLMVRERKLGIPALVLAILIALSRLYLFVHYPTDVLAGVVLGVLFAFLGIRIIDALYARFKKKPEIEA